jgi:hypothetical protein
MIPEYSVIAYAEAEVEWKVTVSDPACDALV